MTTANGEEPPSAGPMGEVDEVAAPLDFSVRARLDFPVVGIGASAGGLGPLRAFLAALPADSGMAFVIVQHLPPEHESLMAEILSRHTAMPVSQIEEGMKVKPNHVYVIRPGFTVTLLEGALHLGAPVEARGHRRPVDDFLRSLAQEQKEKAIAIILSGMGTNGTSGAQAIKAAGGLCVAQEPESAEFPGMPQSLIYAGYADQVLKPEDMPRVLIHYVRHPYLESDQGALEHAQIALLRDRQHLNEIMAILRTRSKHDFTGYKKPTVLRRIQRRMGVLSLQSLADYAAHLREDDDEVAALANDLMINVTGFFRDPAAWEALRNAVVVPLMSKRDNDSTLRAWVTACASGEEPYSLAMLLAEEMDRAGKRFEIKIFATDTADKSLALARAGVYPGGIEGDLPPERLERFFDKDEHTYRVKKEIREMVVFAPQDVLRDPPFSKVDICTCRNLLIYLEPEVQRRVLALLHFSLRDGGYLFLGNAETLGTAEKTFQTISKKWRIYRRVGPAQHQFVDLPEISARSLPGLRQADAFLSPLVRSSSAPVQQALLDRFAPPTVVVDRHHRIVYFHGDTSAYLGQPAGEPTRNLFEVLRSPLRSSVRRALRQAASENRAVSVSAGAQATSAMGRVQISVAPLPPLRTSEYFAISFTMSDEAASAELASSLAPPAALLVPWKPADADSELEGELRSVQRELQDTVEAFEASNEELKASNEEVISVNEELQSANEELETGKEELQSLNEELITVNGQLQAKIAEGESTANDLTNLLSSTNIAVLFLDTQFHVRRFTPALSDLLELIPADIGRPITHLAQKFSDANLVNDARLVLSRLIPIESEMQSNSGVWYLRRTLPYRTSDNRIAGVVITFIDITARRRAEQSLAASQERLQAVIEQMPTPMLMVESPTGEVVFGNRGLAKLFGLAFPLPLVGADWATAAASFIGYRSDGEPYRIEDWPLARTLATGETINEEEIAYRRTDGTEGTLLVSSIPIHDRHGEVSSALASFWDITSRKVAAEALRESEQRCRLLIESAVDYAIFTADAGGRITSWNNGAQRLLGWTETEAMGRPAAMIFTPQDRAEGKPEQEMRQAVRDGRAVDERQHIRKDGSRFWASGILTVLSNETGTMRGFAKIMRDNTERRESEAKLHQALQQSEAIRATVESANRAKDEFISTVSHELRTPLNTIRLWSRMLGSGRVPHEDWGEGIRMVDRAALAQQRLIDDLLDVSRMSTGQLRLAMRATRLSEAIKAALQAVQPLAEARNINIESHLSDAVRVVRADPDRIQQVLWNLLANAVKFTPGGGRINVQMERHGGQVEIRVQDNGSGITSEFLPHVFERFRQAEGSTTRRHGGLGLGLAIAKQLIELHGGDIGVSSEGEGRGATFTVRLPLKETTGEAEEDAPAQTGDIRESLGDIRILLVEDDPATRQATCRLLEMHGAAVQTVEAAAAAREAYSIRPPDLLICDIGLPGEDGFALIEQIRSIENDRGLPQVAALALTAFARADDQQRALNAGFNEHLAKPVNTDALVATIRRLAPCD